MLGRAKLSRVPLVLARQSRGVKVIKEVFKRQVWVCLGVVDDVCLSVGVVKGISPAAGDAATSGVKTVHALADLSRHALI